MVRACVRCSDTIACIHVCGPQHPPHLQFFPLLRGHDPQSGHHQPAAFVVLDVSANLSCHSRVTIAIQIVVLVTENKPTYQVIQKNPQKLSKCLHFVQYVN